MEGIGQVPDRLVDHARRFLASGAVPDAESVREAMTAMARHAIGEGEGPWTPPAVIRDHTSLAVERDGSQSIVGPRSSGRLPERSLFLKVALDGESVRYTSVNVLVVVDDWDRDHLDPIVYGYAESAPAPVVGTRTTWVFRRGGELHFLVVDGQHPLSGSCLGRLAFDDPYAPSCTPDAGDGGLPDLRLMVYRRATFTTRRRAFDQLARELPRTRVLGPAGRDPDSRLG